MIYDVYGRTESSRIYLAKPGKNLLGCLNGTDANSCILTLNLINAHEVNFDVYRYHDEEQTNYYDYIDILMELYVDGFGWYIIDESPVVHNDGIKEYKTVSAKSYEYTLHQYDLVGFDVNTASPTSREMLATDNVYTYVENSDVWYNLFRDRVLFYRDTSQHKELLNTMDPVSRYEDLQQELAEYPQIVYHDWRITIPIDNELRNGFATMKNNASSEGERTLWQNWIDNYDNSTGVTSESVKTLLLSYPNLIKYIHIEFDKRKYIYDNTEGKYLPSDEEYTAYELMELEYKRMKELSLLDLILSVSGVPGWEIGIVDKKLYPEHTDSNGSQIRLQDEIGSFEIDSQDVYSFLINGISGYFDCIFTFDTINNKINALRIETLGIDTKIFLGFRNVQNSVDITPAQDLYTQLTVENSEGLTISDVNFGEREIEDISYFLNTKYLSQELIDKYNNWNSYREEQRDSYIQLSRDYNVQNEIVTEIKNRVPSDMLNISQLDGYTSYDQLEDIIDNYYALMIGILNGFIYVSAEGITVPGDIDSYSTYNDYIDAMNDYVDQLYNLVDVNKESSATSFEDSIYYNDYIMMKNFTVPNLVIAYNNLSLPSYETKQDYIDSYEYDFETYGDMYGLDELKHYQQRHLDSMNVKQDFAVAWEDIPDTEEGNAYKAKYTEDYYTTNHNLYLKYRNGYDSVNNEIDERQREYDEAVSQLETIGTQRRELADSVNIKNYSVNNEKYFTDNEVEQIYRLYRHTDYVNDNISYLYNIDNTNTIIDKQLRMYNEAMNELFAESHPQYMYTTSVDDLLANNEYELYHPEFNVGNFIRLGLDDETQVKLRITMVQFNPMSYDNNLQITFSNMVRYWNKRNDFQSLLNSAITSAKNSITARYNRSADSDSTVQVTYDLVQKILQSSPFTAVTQNIQQSSVNAITGTFDTLAAGYIKTDELAAKLADIDELHADSAFMRYLEANLVVAATVDTEELVVDIIRGHNDDNEYYIDMITGALNMDTITTNLIQGQDGNNQYYIDMITGALDMNTLTTNLIQGHDEYENYYIDMISGAINMDTIYSNLVTGTDGNNHYYIDLLTGELNMGTLYSNFIAATDGNGNYYVDLLTGELNMDTITTNLITGTDGNNQYYIDLVTGALNMDTLYSNFITATDSNNNYYIDLLTGQLNMDTIYTNLITGTDGNNQHYIDLLTGELNMDTIYTNLITGTNGNNQYYIDLLTGTIVGKQVFADEVTTLSINALDQSTARSKIINLVAQNISVSDLQAGDIVLSNQMRILTESTATEGMVMSGSEIQFLDANGNPSISIGYNTVSDGQGGTTVDYDHPTIVIKDENGSVILNSEGLSQNDVGIAPMIQSHSVTEGKLSFDFIKTPNGDIIVQNFDGSTSTWGREITEFVNSVDDKLETPHPTDVDVVYAVSSSNIIAPLSGWDTTAPSYTLGAYVWEKVITTYENSSTSDTSPVCIQPSGEQYDSILEQYYKSTSNSTQANGSWTTTKPTWESGYYIWTRSIINWTSGDPTYSTPVLATPDQSIYASTINTIRDIATQDEQGRWSLTQGVMQNTYVYTDEEQTNPVSLAALGSSITTTTEGIVASVEKNVVELINTESDRRKALYGTCLTEADTAIKEVMCDNFELYTGATISVEFKYQNTQEKPKLNVEGTGEYLIKSYKNEELSEEEYSWDAGSVLDFVFDGRRWRMLDNGAIKKIYTAESRIDMNADKIRAMVTVDGQTSSITLTQNMLEAITDQFVVKSPNGSETIISGGLLSTNAIKSNNYVAPPDGPNPYSITGTFLNLANGNIHSPNFAVDNVNKHAYLNGTIHTKAGEIGGFTITENSIYNNMTSLDDEVDDEDIPLGEGIYLEAQDYYVLDEDDYLTTNFRPVLYGVYIGTDGIALGKGKFKVDAFGNMYANSATIVGDITATSLHIENGAMVDGVVTPNELAKVKAVYGTCDTLAADQEKVVVLNDFDYYKGAIITVGFTNGNTHLSPTLNVNQKGAKTVKSYLNTTLTEADAKWPAGASVMFVYDGTNWLMQDAGVLRVNDLVSNVQDIITVQDTRNDIVRPPQWYINNYPRKRIMEFKTTTALGLTGDTYCWLQTDIPWTDSNGGWPKQVVEVNGKQYWRQGVDADTWSDWIDAYATALESANTANNFIATDNTGIMVYDGTAQRKTSATVTTGNVLITSNGMKVRNGQLVLAEYGDGIKLYDPAHPNTAVVDINQNGATFTGSIVASSLSILPSAVISGVATSGELDAVSAVANAAATNTDLTNEVNQRKAKYGTSNTTATTQVKNVTCDNFELIAGNELTVKFSTANTYASGAVQLNVNSKGAKNVWVANAITSSTNKLLWGAGAYITFRYDGTQFIVIGEPRIWYGESNAAATANTKSDNVTQAVGCVICKGTIVNLAMTYENTATAPTLNIQSTGDLPIYAGNGTTRPLADNGLSWASGTSQDFVFDGVQWRTSDSGSSARSKSQSDAAAKVANNYIASDNNGIMVYDGISGPRTSTNVATGNALITSDGMKVRKGTTVLAEYGTAIKLYNPSTGATVVNIDQNGGTFTGGIVASSLTIQSGATISGLPTSGDVSGLSDDLTTEINQRKAKYGTQPTSSTAETDQVKVITCSNFELVAGNELTIYFQYKNTYISGTVQLNVNSKGAKNVWVGNAITSASNRLVWGAGAYITFRYDGSKFIVIGDPRTWYGACTTAAATAAKTDTTAVTGCVICKGAVVNLAMTYENTADTPTLNIQSTGAFNIYASNTTSTVPTAANGLSWSSGTTQNFVFDGQNWKTADSGASARAKALADKASETATSFIYYNTPEEGVKIHNASDLTDYIQINSNGISLRRNNVEKMYVDDTSFRMGGIGTNIRNVYITDSAVQIRNNENVLAEYGSTISIYNPITGAAAVVINQDGATFTGNIVASHLTIEDPSEIEALIDPDSINVKTGIYVSCSTGGAYQDKELTISNFSYYQGVTITVGFTNANTHATPRFKINSGNAVAIKGYTGADLAEAEYKWAAGAAITFVYDGSNWRMQDSGAQQAKASAASSASQASGSASQASSYASNASSSASSASSSASSASSSASSASGSATSANNAKEAAESARDVALETVTIKDTRSDNQNPQWYITNYPKRRVMEFKSTSVIGLSGDTYCWLQTDVPWSDSSGGWPKQLAEVNGKQYWRQGASGTAWSAWIDASAVATNYITDITANNGIWITPSDKKPNSNGEAVTTGSNATTGIHIDGNGMNVYKNGTSVAFYGDYARIGSDTGVAFNINSNSLEAYYMNGTTRTRYFQVTPTSMTYGTAAVASQAYADNKASTAESNASYSVDIKISSIDYSIPQAVLVAIPYHKGSTTLPTGVSASFVWYKNAVGTAHGGTVSGTGDNTLTVTDLNASYIAVLQ